MSTLGQAVAKRLNPVGKEPEETTTEETGETIGEEIKGTEHVDPAEVEHALAAHQISTSASTPSPAQLQATRLQFSGTKVLTGVTADGKPTDTDAVEEVPFTFNWDLSTGLNGVGSDRNLRGKSSVLRVLMWALRGRCDLQPEVRDWIDHVQLDFTIDTDAYTVAFDVDHDDHHYPKGSLTRTRAQKTTTVGTFTRPDEFEEVMGTAMMQALRLPSIAAQTDGQRVQHVWPTYAGALLIRGDTLDNLLGEIQFAGLPSRLLSMFVGAEWAAARAEATTAVSVAKAKLADLEKTAEQHSAALGEAHARALAQVTAAKAKLHAITVWPAGMDAIRDALARIPPLDAEASRLVKLLRTARSDHAEADAQLKDEQARRHREMSEAVAVKFFQNLKPTVCPRCSAPVTDERIRAESQGESCSVCATGLDLSAHQHDLVLSSTVPEKDRLRLEHDMELLQAAATAETGADGGGKENAGNTDEDNIDDIVDDLVALVNATRDAETRVTELAGQLQAVEGERDQLAGIIEANSDAQTAAQQRQEALIELARAEGAAAALAPEDGPVGPDKDTINAVRAELRILEAAQTITTKWVQDGQKQQLEDLSASITTLARSFGMSNLTEVKLGGGATMKVIKGGSESPYTKTERGEKLRLKLATAIALVQQGRESGVGRHPGLLFVDSPGTEEVNDDDFDTMLDALHNEASAADIQVFIGTCHIDALVALLGEDRCRLGRGDNFVW